MEIGIIGTGDMGKLYAREFVRAGYRVNCCDLPERRSQLEKELGGSGVHVLRDGIAVSRRSDLIIYSVEAENIGKAVQQYGPSTKKGAIVAGQTSEKTPEIEAFEKYLPKDVNINTIHSLHGSSLSPEGQTLVVIRHRSSDNAYKRALDVFEKLGSKIVEMTYQKHDKITADTQGGTQIGFKSMGTAWKKRGFYPWENPSYLSGIDNVKILMCLRGYSGKPHVSAGLAILNPFAKEHIRQYAKSVSSLFGMMIQEDEKRFKERIRRAGDFVFGNVDSPIMLDDKVMGEFSLRTQAKQRKPNSHLSLLAMVDNWYQLEVNPYNNLICQTPPFRLRLGIVEYLFRDKRLLEESLDTALFDKRIRRDDLEFCIAVKEWASIIENGDMVGYKKKFEDTKAFFSDRLEEAKEKRKELIRRLTEKKVTKF